MNRHNFINDIIIVVIIILLPFLFFLYLIVPDQPSFEFYGIVVNSGDYESIDALSWYSVNYLLSITLLSIWFVSCKHWWRYTILFLIYMEVRKLILMIDDTNHQISNEFSSFIYISIFLITLLLISKSLKYYSNKKSINQQLDEEIDSLLHNVSNFNKNNYKDFNSRLIKLRKEKKHLDKKEYLTQLIKLREEYSINE